MFYVSFFLLKISFSCLKIKFEIREEISTYAMVEYLIGNDYFNKDVSTEVSIQYIVNF